MSRENPDGSASTKQPDSLYAGLSVWQIHRYFWKTSGSGKRIIYHRTWGGKGAVQRLIEKEKKRK